MQLLASSTTPRPQFVSLSVLVQDDPAQEDTASLGEPFLLASPTSTISALDATDALQELHTHLTYTRRADASLGNVSEEDRITVELLRDHHQQQSNDGLEIYRPLAASGIGMCYRVVEGGPELSLLTSLALTQENSKLDPGRIHGVVLCVGVAGLAYCSVSLEYTLAQRMNDLLGILPKIGTQVELIKSLLTAFLLSPQVETNEAMEAAILFPEVDETVKGAIMSPIRKPKKSSASGKSSTAVPLETDSSADLARDMMDHLTLLSVAETDTFLRKYKVPGQERKANVDLAGKSRFRRRKADGGDLDNFDYKGPPRVLKLPGASTHKKSQPAEADSMSVNTSSTKTSLRSSRKDTKTKAGALPLLSASRSDAAPSRSRRTTNISSHSTSRPKFDDATSEHRNVFDSSHSAVSSMHRVQVNIALNEDLSCTYMDSSLSTCTVEGVVQVSSNCDPMQEICALLCISYDGRAQTSFFHFDRSK